LFQNDSVVIAAAVPGVSTREGEKSSFKKFSTPEENWRSKKWLDGELCRGRMEVDAGTMAASSRSTDVEFVSNRPTSSTSSPVKLVKDGPMGENSPGRFSPGVSKNPKLPLPPR